MSFSPSTSTVSLEISDQVAFLTLARPEVANTMNLQFGHDFLAAVLALVAATPRAVVLSGQGKNFCFGGDLKSMVASRSDVQAYLSELATTLHTALIQLVSLNAPVIAAVYGTAAGAGLGLVLAAILPLPRAMPNLRLPIREWLSRRMRGVRFCCRGRLAPSERQICCQQIGFSTQMKRLLGA